ncbi:MAG: hypothetical protein M1830_005091, partial [Pleopsidium flavum]
MAQPNPPAAAVSAKPDVPNIPQGGDDGKATTNSSKEVSSTNPPRWDMFPLRIATAGEPVTVEIPRSASIPSPVADCGERRNQLLKFVNERASRGVRTLFNKIREAGNPQPGGLTLKQIMLVGSLSEISPLSSDRENGFIVYLGEQRAHSLEQHQSEDRGIDAEVRQEWVQDNYMLRLYSDAADPTYYQPPARRSSVLARLTSPLDIRRLSGASSAGKAITGFFVLNSSHTPLRINGVLFNPNAL